MTNDEDDDERTIPQLNIIMNDNLYLATNNVSLQLGGGSTSLGITEGNI